MVDRQTLGWFRLPFVANPASAGGARWTFSIKREQMPASAQQARVRNVAKVGQIIFSRSSRKSRTGASLIPDYGVNKRRTARFRFTVEMRWGVPRISCVFAEFNVGKPHAMGACARVTRRIERLSTVSHDAPDRSRRFSSENA
jgi:hypothetical protein